MINCIICDDEPLALQVLEDYVRGVPFLECKGIFRDLSKARTFLDSDNIDLIFLDVNMPGLSGIQFLESIKNRPLIVFTTAYAEHAVRSYDFEAVDYLLKPIEYGKFCRAVDKAFERLIKKAYKPGRGQESRRSILVKSGTEHHKINSDAILFLKAMGNYVCFTTEAHNILCLMSLKEATNLLQPGSFVRVHKSFVINLERVEAFETNTVRIGKYTVPIGDSYRTAFLRAIKLVG